MKIWSLLILGWLCACHKAAPPLIHETPKADTLIAESEEESLPLHYKVTPLPEPHRYQVELDWSGAPAKSAGWALTREDESLETATLFQGDEAVRTWTDDTVEEGKGYRYSLWRSAEGELTLHSQVGVRISLDRVVDGVEETSRIAGVRRLFLTPAARLRPSGAELRIEVDEIHSDGGTIESFPKESVALAGDGRSGAPMFLKAGLARGKLTIIARGENAKAGAEGKSGAAGADGRPGKDAESGRRYEAPANFTGTFLGLALCPLFQNCHRMERQEDVDRFYELARQKVSPHFTHASWTQLFVCKQDLERGQNGSSGEPGGDGAAGGKGGDASALHVEIADSKDFLFKIETEPGQGGAGGKAGAGGAGGKGSASGKPDAMGLCPTKPGDGMNGPNGASGKAGPAGIPGKILPQCLKLGGTVMGDCPTTPAG